MCKQNYAYTCDDEEIIIAFDPSLALISFLNWETDDRERERERAFICVFFLLLDQVFLGFWSFLFFSGSPLEV